MSSKFTTRSDNSPRTPVIIIGAIAGGLILLAMAGSLLYLFSRKERARRRNAQEFSPVQPPPAYKEELGSPRNLQHQPRPLSSFAPDYSRQAQYHHHHHHQLSRNEQPPPYPTLPTYDPSQYQPIRPTSMVGDMRTYYQPGPSSRLSAVHYSDARLSTYHPVSLADPGPVRPDNAGSRDIREIRNIQNVRDNQDNQHSHHQDRGRGREIEGRERSHSEPMLSGQPAPKPPKPVLSRLITNFR
ncbi:unnamed protein product [Penicillium salamii]|nr:unnamed protein product [Penicillium salamii]